MQRWERFYLWFDTSLPASGKNVKLAHKIPYEQATMAVTKAKCEELAAKHGLPVGQVLALDPKPIRH